MSHPSDPSLLVLHGLRLKGFADTDRLADATGVDPAAVLAALTAFATDELVQRREGRLTGWSLTPRGRDELEARLAAELDATGGRGLVDDAYRRFLALNPELLEVCTDFQVRGDVVNDHTDRGYDHAVVARLTDLHDRARPLCDDLAKVLARFGGYGDRLDAALARVRAGEHHWFTKPLIDSYHTVWFELHEDLLATLGVDRADEHPETP
jgi:DNA-binding MarR family transcriptional regulator